MFIRSKVFLKFHYTVIYIKIYILTFNFASSQVQKITISQITMNHKRHKKVAREAKEWVKISIDFDKFTLSPVP